MRYVCPRNALLICLCTLAFWACDDGGSSSGSDSSIADAATGGADLGPTDAEPPLLDTGATVGPEIDVNPRSMQLLADTGGEGRGVVTIHNLGTSPLQLDEVRLEGGDPAFELDLEDAPTEIPPQGQYELTVIYTPQVPGLRRETLLVRSNDMDEAELRLSITGRIRRDCVGANPPRIDFGAIEGGATSGRFRLAVDNCGDIPITITSLTIEGLDGVTVTLENNDDPLEAVIMASTILPLSVKFTNETLAPGAVGEGLLTIGTSSVETPEIRVQLQAEGLMSTSCIAAFQPNRLDFGALRVGEIARMEVELSNIGGGVCEVRELSLARLRGSNPFPLSIVPGFNLERLEPESSVTIEVVFAPIETNGVGELGELRLDYHDPEANQNRRATAQVSAVSAEAQIGRIDDGALFGEVTSPGCGSWVRWARVENANSVPLCVTDVSLRGADCDDFRITERPEIGDCLQLEAFEELAVPVVFQPTALGERACSVVFTSDADNRRDLPVPLIGEGVDTDDAAARFVVGRLNPAATARFVLDRPADGDSLSVTVDDEPTLAFGFDAPRNAITFAVGEHPERGAVVRATYQALCLDRLE